MKFRGLAIASFLAATAMSSAAQDKTLTVAAPKLLGHFDENGLGRTADFLDEIYKECGWKVRTRLYNFGLHWTQFESNFSLDAVALAWDQVKVKGYPSKPFVFQPNGVIMLDNKAESIKSLDDLKGLKVASFAGANKLFPVLKDHIPNFATYREMAGGLPMVKVLTSSEFDAIITDGLIFATDYYRKIVTSAGTYGDNRWPKVKFIQMLPTVGDRVLFRNQQDAIDFNRCYDRANAKDLFTPITKRYEEVFKGILHEGLPTSLK